MCRFLFDGRAISPNEAEEIVEASHASFTRHGYGIWLVFDDRHDALAGFAGILHPAGGSPSLVYGVRDDLAGNGYATEAAAAVLRHCFETLGLPRVAADVDEPNEASVRILEKLGMIRVGRRVVDGRPLLDFSIDAASAASVAVLDLGRTREQ